MPPDEPIALCAIRVAKHPPEPRPADEHNLCRDRPGEAGQKEEATQCVGLQTFGVVDNKDQALRRLLPSGHDFDESLNVRRAQFRLRSAEHFGNNLPHRKFA
jgi:hypothetical protein